MPSFSIRRKGGSLNNHPSFEFGTHHLLRLLRKITIMKKSKDSVISVAIKGTLLAATAMAADVLEFDPETLGSIKRGCDLMLGWSINRLTSNVDKIQSSRSPSLEELEINGHLVRLAGEATKLVLQAEIRDRKLGKDFDKDSLNALKDHALENWLVFPDRVRLRSQSFTDLVTFEAMDQRVTGVFTSKFWMQFIEFSFRNSKPSTAASPDFIKSLADILYRKFPGIFFELAKSTAERDSQTFASIQLHFLGAIRHGQQQTDRKIDRLYELVIESVGKSTGGLKPREVTRLSKAAAQLYAQFEDLRPLLERLPENYQKDLADAVSAINKNTTIEGIRTRSLIVKTFYALLTCFGILISVTVITNIRKDQINWERGIRDQKLAAFLDEIEGIDRLPPDEKLRVFDRARRHFAESLGIAPEDIEASLIEDARLIAEEARDLKIQYLRSAPDERNWRDVLEKLMKAGDLAQAAEEPSLANEYLQEALALAETIDAKADQSMVLMKLGDSASSGNQVTRAQEFYESAVSRAAESGELTVQIDALTRLVNHLRDAGNIGLAKARSDELLNLIQEGGELGTLPSHALFAHGKVLRTIGQPAEALKVMERAVESHSGSCKNPVCGSAPEFLLELADTQYEIGYFDKAAESLAEARALIKGVSPLEVQALSLGALILLSRNQDESEPEEFARERLENALAEAESAVAHAKEKLPDQWLLQVNALQVLAEIQASQERGAGDAMRTVETARELVILHEGENSRGAAWLAYRAGTYALQAGSEEAATKYLRMAAKTVGMFPASDPIRIKLIEGYLGNLLRKQDIQGIQKTLEDMEEAHRDSVQPRPFNEMEIEMLKGVVALYSNHSGASELHFRRAEELAAQSPEIGREFVHLNQMLRGMAQAILGENPEGAAVVQQAIAALGEIEGLEKGWRDSAELIEAAATMQYGGAEKAVPFYERQIRDQRARSGERHVSVAGLLVQLGRAYFSVGREDDALKSFEEMKSILTESEDDWDVVAATGALAYGNLLVEQGRPQEAVFLIDQSVRHLIRLMGKEAWLTGLALLGQSKLELALEDHESAKLTGKQALEIVKASGVASPRVLLEATLPIRINLSA
jgi:hypothetical protein